MKQQNRKKSIAWGLLITLLASTLFSCKSGSSEKENSSAQQTTVTETAIETEDESLKSNLPSDLDFKGETINIWYFTKNTDTSESFIDIAGNLDGDVVDAALYDRNRQVEEQLNLKMNFVDPGVASSDVGNAVRKLMMSGSDEYDLFNVVQWNSASLVLENLFLNMYDAPYLDLEKPWWAYNYMKEIAIGKDNLYFLCGDVSLDMIRCIAAIYYNKNMVNDLYGDPDILYKTVLDGKWTLDALGEYTKNAYSDLNGNNKTDADDQLGFAMNTYNNLDAFIYGSDIHVTARDEKGIPYLVLNNDKTANFTEKLYTLANETKGGMIFKDNLEAIKKFVNEESMFLFGWFYTSEKLRDMRSDYGIIPFPKYDEAQEQYLSVVHDIATLLCVPTTCKKVEAVSAMLEAMAYTSYKMVTPAYYETALKTKYTRDEVSSQIIDILHDNNTTDIAYIYGPSFNNLGYIMRELIPNKKKDFASAYAKKEKPALKGMEKLIEQYTLLQ